MSPSGLPWGLDFEARLAPGIEGTIGFDHGIGALSITVNNTSDRPVAAGDVVLQARVDEPATGGWALIQGRHMMEDALVRRFGEPPEEGYRGHYREGDGIYLSRDAVAVVFPARPTPALLVGSLQTGRFTCDVRLHLSRDESLLEALSITFPTEGLTLGPGESLELPPVLLETGADAYDLLERYAERVAVEAGARVAGHVPSGWCSWYQFYGRVTEADVLASLDSIRGHGLPLDYVQVDDGYQSHTGDWLQPNDRFPSGMATLASRIRDAGYRPGLWLAPFVMHEDSRVFAEQPELALRTRDGELLLVDTWLGRCAVLDCTLPAARDWLSEVVRTVVGEWGYTFLKLDALVFAARPGDQVRYHEPGTTALGNVRAGLEAVREAAGDEAFLLGCTCPFGPAIGLVDAMRVGPDVKTTWADGVRPSVRYATRLALQRNWMHRRWWLNDPDCFVLREAGSDLDEAEIRFLATAVALSGGLAASGDDLARLEPGRAALARSLVPPPGVAARPLDPGDGPVPSAWRARLDETRSLIGILNWSDEARWVSPGAYLEAGEVAFEPWSARLLGKGDLLLRPHEGSLWQVSAPSPTPRAVGDTGHLDYAGLYRRQVSGRLQLRNDSEFARTVAVEARGRVNLYLLEPGEMRWFD